MSGHPYAASASHRVFSGPSGCRGKGRLWTPRQYAAGDTPSSRLKARQKLGRLP